MRDSAESAEARPGCLPALGAMTALPASLLFVIITIANETTPYMRCAWGLGFAALAVVLGLIATQRDRESLSRWVGWSCVVGATAAAVYLLDRLLSFWLS